MSLCISITRCVDPSIRLSLVTVQSISKINKLYNKTQSCTLAVLVLMIFILGKHNWLNHRIFNDLQAIASNLLSVLKRCRNGIEFWRPKHLSRPTPGCCESAGGRCLWLQWWLRCLKVDSIDQLIKPISSNEIHWLLTKQRTNGLTERLNSIQTLPLIEMQGRI